MWVRSIGRWSGLQLDEPFDVGVSRDAAVKWFLAAITELNNAGLLDLSRASARVTHGAEAAHGRRRPSGDESRDPLLQDI
jgi:hypothetical protein